MATKLAALTGVTGKAAAAGIEATGRGHGLTAATLAAATATVEVLLLEAVRALAAPGDAATHLAALAQLRAAVMGGHDLEPLTHRYVPPVFVQPVPIPPPPDPETDAALAAAMAALTDHLEKQ